MTHYLDTSVAMHILSGRQPGAAEWFDETTADPGARVISSRLLRTELIRTLRRIEQPVSHADHILDHVDMVPLDHAVLQEAEAIVPHVKTLDAIHLASALRSGIDGIIVCSHDANMLEVARQLGLSVLDPVAQGHSG